MMNIRPFRTDAKGLRVLLDYLESPENCWGYEQGISAEDSVEETKKRRVYGVDSCRSCFLGDTRLRDSRYNIVVSAGDFPDDADKARRHRERVAELCAKIAL